MNVAIGQGKNGAKLLLLILEPGNIHRLIAGEPIQLRVEDYFPEGIPRRLNLGLLHSDTPVADARKLAEMSEVTLDERTPRLRTKPACPQCKSTIEQAGVGRNESPIAFVFCVMCGATLGVLPRAIVEGLK